MTQTTTAAKGKTLATFLESERSVMARAMDKGLVSMPGFKQPNLALALVSERARTRMSSKLDPIAAWDREPARTLKQNMLTLMDLPVRIFRHALGQRFTTAQSTEFLAAMASANAKIRTLAFPLTLALEQRSPLHAMAAVVLEREHANGLGPKLFMRREVKNANSTIKC